MQNGTKMNQWIIRFRQCLFLLTVGVYFGFAGQDIRYHFDPGQSSSYSVEMKRTAEGQGMGQDFSLSSKFSIDCSLTAVEKKDSAFTVICILFRSFKGVLNFPLMGFYDSSFTMNEWTDKRIRLSLYSAREDSWSRGPRRYSFIEHRNDAAHHPRRNCPPAHPGASAAGNRYECFMEEDGFRDDESGRSQYYYKAEHRVQTRRKAKLRPVRMPKDCVRRQLDCRRFRNDAGYGRKHRWDD